MDENKVEGAPQFGRVLWLRGALRSYGVYCILIVAISWWIFPLAAIALTLVGVALISSVGWYKLPDAEYEFDDFPCLGKTISSCELETSSLHHKHNLSSENEDTTSIKFATSFRGIHYGTAFLAINSPVGTLIVRPDRFWLKCRSRVIYGNAFDISVSAFSTEQMVRRPRRDDKVLESTWLYHTKRGEKDLRYKNNPKMWSVERYGVTLTLQEYEWDLHLFSEGNRDTFAAAFIALTELMAPNSDDDGQFEEGEEGEEEDDEEDRADSNSDPEDSPASWWEVLEVAPSAGTEEIRSAYHKLMKQYHPDRVAHLGKKLRAVAEQEAKAINEAYERALRRS